MAEPRSSCDAERRLMPADADKLVLFHGPDSELSNFRFSPFDAPHPFTGAPVVYRTVEHYFQAHKSVTPEGHDEVVACKQPKDAKAVGRRVPLRPDWEQFKTAVMLDGLRRKYRDPARRQRLYCTGDRIIGEDSPCDFEWGIRDDAGGYGGQNLLGLALMRIRDEIRADHAFSCARLTTGLALLGTQTLFHIARAAQLPQIVADGELRSIYTRAEHDPSPQPQSGHGAAQGLTWGYVSLSFRPAWWLCKRYDEELVLLEVDARTALLTPGTLTSPVNCAGQGVTEPGLLATSNLGAGAAEGLLSCFDVVDGALGESRPKMDAEVLVPDRLPLSAVTGLVFCDQTARDFWWPQVQSSPLFAGATVHVTGDSASGFPVGWTPTVRQRPSP